jgi:hypothetical protein
VAVLLDQLANVLRMQPGLRADVSDGATQSHVILDQLGAGWIFEQIVDIGLPDTEASVQIAAVMRFVTFSHVIRSPPNRMRLYVLDHERGKAQAFDFDSIPSPSS